MFNSDIYESWQYKILSKSKAIQTTYVFTDKELSSNCFIKPVILSEFSPIFWFESLDVNGALINLPALPPNFIELETKAPVTKASLTPS